MFPIALFVADVAQASEPLEEDPDASQSPTSSADAGAASTTPNGLRGYVSFTGTGYLSWSITVNGEYRWRHVGVSAAIGGGQAYVLLAKPDMFGATVAAHTFVGSAKAFEAAAGLSVFGADDGPFMMPYFNVGFRAEDRMSGLLVRVGLGVEMVSFGPYISLGLGPKATGGTSPPGWR